jgi:hypothetical protein
MIRARALLTAALVVTAVPPGLGACAPASASGSAQASAPTATERPIASVHQQQCGRCHAPPEPGRRTREEVESAAGRHRKRVRLSPEEWVAMITFLSATPN